MDYEIKIIGIPMTKERPRITKCRAYTPKKTAEHEKYIKECWQEKYKNLEPSIKPISLTAIFYMPIPKNTSKKRKQEMISGKCKHVRRPDIDNLVKAVLDALNGIAYKDDNQIYEIHTYRKYSQFPKTELFLYEEDTEVE